MRVEVEPADWECLDSWWGAYKGLSPVSRKGDSALYKQKLAESWSEIDSWWDTYTESGYETAVQIKKLLERSNDRWKRSNAPFDTDPLAEDLTDAQLKRGPLNPGAEVEWSKWLAQLIRPSEALVTELFDITVDGPPSEVVREERFSKGSGSYRRPDVLLYYADQGVSIEVKLGDENYQKTAETAHLIEQQYSHKEWVHTLLLPKRKKNRLDSLVEPPVEQNERGPQVAWNNSPVNVLYWRDVTAAIRSILRQDAMADDHWAANAYLFCAVTEQQVIGFQSEKSIERFVDPKNVVDALRPIGLDDTLEKQLKYLDQRGSI